MMAKVLKITKSIVSIVLALSMIASLCACSFDFDSVKEQGENILKRAKSWTIDAYDSVKDKFVEWYGTAKDTDDEKKIAMDMETILTLLFDSVKNGEKEIFKTYFADDALSVSDFEEGCDYVFSQYRGDLLEIDCHLPLAIGTHFVPGERIYRAYTNFDIITSENEYVVFIDCYTQYSKYPEGSYKIKGFKLLTKQMIDDGEGFTDCSLRNGIYYPDWPLPEVN